MAIIVEPTDTGWRRFRGSATLSAAKVSRLVEAGVWTDADLAPLGLRQAVPFAVPEGQIATGPERFEAEAGQVVQVFATEPAPEPEPRRVGKSVVLSRITDAQLEVVLAVMTPMQMERWRSPDSPTVRVNDPEVIAMIMACEADPETVLAPEAAP